MATSKQPPFPHPPLETGVPQYPTPNVPDFYTKSGHIVLVEKVSAEKGSYNPQPLDGSVTYQGRDANKWPSTLYLVAIRPEPTGEFVYRFWANDRTLASQDPWNFNVQYSSSNPAFPIYTRTYIVPRSQYASVAIGSIDPVFGGNAKIVDQEMAELSDDNPLRSRYVAVKRVYETIPGPALVGKRINSMGAIEDVTSQVVDPSTTPDTSGLLVSDSIKSIGAAKSERERVVMEALPPTYNYFEVTHDLGIIKNTVELVQRNLTGGTPAPVISGNIIDVNDAPLEFPWVRRTTKYIQTDGSGNPILPPSRVEYKTGSYVFPGVIYNWDTTLVNGQIESQLSFFQNRYPIQLTVPIKHEISYQIGEPDISNLRFFKVVTQPWAREFFKIPDGCIHPPAPVTLIGQTIYQNGISYGIQGGQASTPTSYLVGQELLIGGETGRWQGNIWYTVLTKVKEPPTTY